jgi:hypothetical protein
MSLTPTLSRREREIAAGNFPCFRMFDAAFNNPASLSSGVLCITHIFSIFGFVFFPENYA